MAKSNRIITFQLFKSLLGKEFFIKELLYL